jgi:Conserved TM helix
MIPAPLRDWGDAIVTSTAPALALVLTGLTRAIAFLVILAIGWMLASLLAKATRALLRKLGFNDLAVRSGLSQFVSDSGFQGDTADLMGHLAKWFVRLAALVIAFDALGLVGVSEFVRQVLLWLPNLAVAVAVLIIGGHVANVLAGVVRGATVKAEAATPETMATITRVAVWVVAIIVAVNQVGVGREVVNTLFIATVAAAALGAAIAFGLGGRETAADVVQRWYARRHLQPNGKAEPVSGAERHN